MTDYKKEFSKFDSDLLAHVICKYAWRELEEILRELRVLRWDKKSSDDLRRHHEENKELSRIAEELKGMPVNTDMEKLAYLKKEQEFFEKARLYSGRQRRREKKTNMLYEEIDGGSK